METLTKFINLKLDKNLLDPNFEGYKLSLDKIPVKQLSLDGEHFSGVCCFNSSDSQWSYKHFQLFSAHNHLHPDFWYSDECFSKIPAIFLFLDNGDICGTTVSLSENIKKWGEIKQVAKFDLPSDALNRGDKYNPCLIFVGPSLALVSNGFGKLTLFETGIRPNFEPWQVVFEDSALCDCGVAFVMKDAVASKLDERSGSPTVIECLVERVVEKEDAVGAQRSVFVSCLEWITLEKMENVWKKIRARKLETRGTLLHSKLSKDGLYLCSLSSTPLVFVADSAKEIVTATENTEEAKENVKEYTWAQSEDCVCVIFNVEVGVKKDDVEWKLTSKEVFLKIGDKEMLNGELGGEIDLDGSTWTLADGRLEVTLSKREESVMTWSEIVIGDTRGEFVPDPDLVREICDRLQPFTSAESDMIENKKPAYNTQELEACDDVTDETCFLAWIDGESHSVVQEADLGGHQFLFTVFTGPEEAASICLRYDVDGIVWSPKSNPSKCGNPTWQHGCTFNAFGYVQASKEQKKYCTCATDYSYAVIVDFTRHVYLYWQPSIVESDLRNRKSGRKISEVAKQQLIALDSNEEIVGVQAFPKILLLLTKNRVYAALLIET